MYRNKAFISYRHVPHDAEVARVVQKNLEQFRIPRGIRAAGRKRHLGRIFRDKTDLGTNTDLTEELQRELDDSEYLIVICSPDAAQSRWVPEEISYFLLHHKSDKILPVLSAGDPEAVYEALFRHSSGAPREPVACDFRGDSRQAVREELPRLISTLIGCTYDELVNRTRRREKKNTAMVASISAAAVLLLSSVAVFNGVSGYRTRQMLRAEQKEGSRLLAELSSEALSRGERFDAIRYAMEGVADEKEKRPSAPEAILALQEATGAYQMAGNTNITQTGEYPVDGEIITWKHGKTDAGAFLAVLALNRGETELKIWNTDTGALFYDSAEKEEEALSPEDTASAESLAAEKKSAVPDSVLFTDQELLWANGRDVVSIDLKKGGKTILETDYISLMPVNRTADGTVFWAYGKTSADLVLLREDGTFEDILSPDKDIVLPLDKEEAQKDSDPDDEEEAQKDADFEDNDNENAGRSKPEEEKEAVEEILSFNILDFQKDTRLSYDRRYLFLHGAVRNEETGEEELICIKDLQTGKTMVPVRGQEIPEVCIRGDTTVRAVVYEGPEQQRFRRDEKSWSSASSEDGKLTLVEADCWGGKIQWAAESACARNVEPRLTFDVCLSGEDREYLTLTAGTVAEIFDRNNGNKLYTAEFPGFIRSVYRGMTPDGEDALMAVLQDGTIAAFEYGSGQISRGIGEIPRDPVSFEKDGDLFLAEYRRDGNDHTRNRILAFRRGVSDDGLREIGIEGEAADLFAGEKICEAEDSLFVVLNEKRQTAVFDAVTGEDVSGQENAEELVDGVVLDRLFFNNEDGVRSGNGKSLAVISGKNTISIMDEEGNLTESIEGTGNAVRGINWLGSKLFWMETAKDGLWLCDKDGRILVDTEEKISDIREETEWLSLAESKGEMIVQFHNTLFRIDRDTRTLSGRIHNVLGYNPMTDTLMLEEQDENGEHVYISNLYTPGDLRKKGDRILNGSE